MNSLEVRLLYKWMMEESRITSAFCFQSNRPKFVTRKYWVLRRVFLKMLSRRVENV